MKPLLACVIIALAASIAGSAAQARESKTSAAWTPLKAERLVRAEASVAAAVPDRADLEQELRSALVTIRAFEAEAMLHGVTSPGPYLLWAKYSLALAKLRVGLSIDAADCQGSGRAARGRYSGFRCSVTTESIAIPPTRLVATENGLVAEGEPRIVGPVEARLQVRVTGTSSFSYRPL